MRRKRLDSADKTEGEKQMSEYVESTGDSLKQARDSAHEKAIDHIRIYPHRASTDSKPRWSVAVHHSADDDRPSNRDFTDGHAMLAHVADTAHVPNDNLGREVLPKEVDNLSGRAQ
jgi:hypothetical protein